MTSEFLQAARRAFASCQRVTLSSGLFASALPPETAEEAAAAESEWAGSPVIVYVLREPRHLAAPEPEPEPEPEPASADRIPNQDDDDEDDDEAELWREVERLLRKVPTRQRAGQIRQSLVAMASAAERAIAVERLRAALDDE